MIFPRVFASERYSTCTTTCLGYEPELDSSDQPLPCINWPSDHDIRRSDGMEWEYLLQNKTMGEVWVHSRGKQLAVAAGHVCI